MVEVISTDDFDKWLRKLKDRVGRLRIVDRLDRLASGSIRAMPNRSDVASGN
ncbi:MAG: hypothetical protein WCA30_09610 [Dermatophilaceae bacterium]